MPGMQQVTARGRFGAAVSFDGRVVTIDKSSRRFPGAGVRVVPLGQVSTVAFTAGWWWVFDGSLGFVVAGASAPVSRPGARWVAAHYDPWTVAFRGRRQRAAFGAVRDAVQAALLRMALQPPYPDGAPGYPLRGPGRPLR